MKSRDSTKRRRVADDSVPATKEPSTPKAKESPIPSSQPKTAGAESPVGLLKRYAISAATTILSPFKRSETQPKSQASIKFTSSAAAAAAAASRTSSPVLEAIHHSPAPVQREASYLEPLQAVEPEQQQSPDAAAPTAASHQSRAQEVSPAKPAAGRTFMVPEDDSDNESELEMAEPSHAAPVKGSPGRTYGLFYDDNSSEEGDFSEVADVEVTTTAAAAIPQVAPEEVRFWNQTQFQNYLDVEHGLNPAVLETAANELRAGKTPEFITDFNARMTQLEQVARTEIERDMERFRERSVQEVRRELEAARTEMATRIHAEIRAQVEDEIRNEYRQTLAEKNKLVLELSAILPFARLNCDNDNLTSAIVSKVAKFYQASKANGGPQGNSSPVADEAMANIFDTASYDVNAADVDAAPIWTQAPPASPSPAHATLPTTKQGVSFGEASYSTVASPPHHEPPKYSGANNGPSTAAPTKSSIKAKQPVIDESMANMTASQQQSYQRALSDVTKYAPKQPSRLREVSDPVASPNAAGAADSNVDLQLAPPASPIFGFAQPSSGFHPGMDRVEPSPIIYQPPISERQDPPEVLREFLRTDMDWEVTPVFEFLVDHNKAEDVLNRDGQPMESATISTDDDDIETE
jgi:hypothetical protein